MTEALEMSCLRCHRVVFTSSDRLECVQVMIVHMERQHPERGHVLTEGHDFMLVPVPTRCDLCGVLAEKPWWEYHTRPGAAEDDRWLVCDACHAVVQRPRPLSALVQRTMRQQRETLAPEHTSGARYEQTVREGMQRFLAAVVGEPIRERP